MNRLLQTRPAAFSPLFGRINIGTGEKDDGEQANLFGGRKPRAVLSQEEEEEEEGSGGGTGGGTGTGDGAGVGDGTGVFDGIDPDLDGVTEGGGTQPGDTTGGTQPGDTTGGTQPGGTVGDTVGDAVDPSPYEYGTMDIGWGINANTPYEGWEGSIGALSGLYKLFPGFFGNDSIVPQDTDVPPPPPRPELESSDYEVRRQIDEAILAETNPAIREGLIAHRHERYGGPITDADTAEYEAMESRNADQMSEYETVWDDWFEINRVGIEEDLGFGVPEDLIGDGAPDSIGGGGPSSGGSTDSGGSTASGGGGGGDVTVFEPPPGPNIMDIDPDLIYEMYGEDAYNDFIRATTDPIADVAFEDFIPDSDSYDAAGMGDWRSTTASFGLPGGSWPSGPTISGGGGYGGATEQAGEELVRALGTALFTDESYDSDDWFKAGFHTLAAMFPYVGSFISAGFDKIFDPGYQPDQSDFDKMDSVIADRAFRQLTGRLDPDAAIIPDDFMFKPRWDTQQNLDSWGGDAWEYQNTHSFDPASIGYSENPSFTTPDEYSYTQGGTDATVSPLGPVNDDLMYLYWLKSPEAAALSDDATIEDRVRARLDWSMDNGYVPIKYSEDMSFMDPYTRESIDADLAAWKEQNPDEYAELIRNQDEAYTEYWTENADEYARDLARDYINFNY